jgi:hypothetical protein
MAWTGSPDDAPWTNNPSGFAAQGRPTLAVLAGRPRLPTCISPPRSGHHPQQAPVVEHLFGEIEQRRIRPLPMAVQPGAFDEVDVFAIAGALPILAGVGAAQLKQFQVRWPSGRTVRSPSFVAEFVRIRNARKSSEFSRIRLRKSFTALPETGMKTRLNTLV